ncbi:MAG: hypothetical protein EXX96DRAFT_533652 [Benjaminiella poitrasii]|nr:MAG: hypothetical protein EXX96DRAFT_533652 [Benjaminiella poitrasii]
MVEGLEKDISRSRIFAIKSVVKHFLFSKTIAASNVITDKLNEAIERVTTPIIINFAAYDNFQIDSIDFAGSNAATVLNSIFNLNTLNETCGSHRLVFANHIKILPGMKTARLLGIKEQSKVVQETYSIPSSTERVFMNISVVEESKKELNEFKREVKASEADLRTLQNDL